MCPQLAAQSATPILAIMALAMSGDCERILAAGADGYLSKPFTVRTLVTAVRELLTKHQSE